MQCICDRQRVEQVDQPSRIRVEDGGPADGFDKVESRSAALVCDHIAKCSPEETDVVVERRCGTHRSRIRDEARPPAGNRPGTPRYGRLHTMTLGSIRHHTFIRRSADAVWELAGDPARLHEWFPGIRSCQVDGKTRVITLGSG